MTNGYQPKDNGQPRLPPESDSAVVTPDDCYLPYGGGELGKALRAALSQPPLVAAPVGICNSCGKGVSDRSRIGKACDDDGTDDWGGCTGIITSIADLVSAELTKRVGDRWRERILNHAVDALDRDLRDGGPVKPPTGEQAALVFIREQAQKIEGYGEALKQAAEWLKAAGKGYQANQIYKVYMHAREEVTALRGSDG